MCVSARRRCKVEQVVPCGAAKIVHCNGLTNVAIDNKDDDDDDVICLDDDPCPSVKPIQSRESSDGSVALRLQYLISDSFCLCLNNEHLHLHDSDGGNMQPEKNDTLIQLRCLWIL